MAISKSSARLEQAKARDVPVAVTIVTRAVGKGAKAVGFAEGEAASEDWVEAVIEFLTELYAEAGEELPAIDPAKPHLVYPADEYARMVATPDDIITKYASYPDPPVNGTQLSS